MIPQEKAKDLFNRLSSYTHNDYTDPKQCALITVNEVIKQCEGLSIQDSGSVYRDFGHVYWNEVKEEINKL